MIILTKKVGTKKVGKTHFYSSRAPGMLETLLTTGINTLLITGITPLLTTNGFASYNANIQALTKKVLFL